jgi:hypothetical protein
MKSFLVKFGRAVCQLKWNIACLAINFSLPGPFILNRKVGFVVCYVVLMSYLGFDLPLFRWHYYYKPRLNVFCWLIVVL